MFRKLDSTEYARSFITNPNPALRDKGLATHKKGKRKTKKKCQEKFTNPNKKNPAHRVVDYFL